MLARMFDEGVIECQRRKEDDGAGECDRPRVVKGANRETIQGSCIRGHRGGRSWDRWQ